MNASNIFRLQLIALQFKRPDVLLVDLSLDKLSYDDTQLLTSFLKTNSMNSTIVLNTTDEYFVQNIANNIIEVDSLDIPTTQAHGDFATVKTKKQEKRKLVEESHAGLTSSS